MKQSRSLLFPLILVNLLGVNAGQADWKQVLADRLPLYGHRNWIVVVDSAYPAQTSPGIETVLADQDQVEVVNAVLSELDRAEHIRPTIYTDAELEHVAEADAPSIGRYRESLSRSLGARSVQSLPHDEIIARLDEAGKAFKVLVIKTPLTLPYTSVFFQLECGYWSDDAEQRLRKVVAEGTTRP